MDYEILYTAKVIIFRIYSFCRVRHVHNFRECFIIEKSVTKGRVIFLSKQVFASVVFYDHTGNWEELASVKCL